MFLVLSWSKDKQETTTTRKTQTKSSKHNVFKMECTCLNRWCQQILGALRLLVLSLACVEVLRCITGTDGCSDFHNRKCPAVTVSHVLWNTWKTSCLCEVKRTNLRGVAHRSTDCRQHEFEPLHGKDIGLGHHQDLYTIWPIVTMDKDYVAFV